MKIFTRWRFVFAGLIINSILFGASGVTFAQGAQTAKAQRARTVRESPSAPTAAPAEATITLNEQFLNSFLEAMFTQLREPEFPLSISQTEPAKEKSETEAAHARSSKVGACTSMIVLERENAGVKTAVKFESGRIVAPLAFSGSYDAALGCFNFSGWANSIVTLEFDRERQALMARVRVQEVFLNGIPRLASGILISMVQGTIDRRFNPYELFKAEQLSPTVAIKAAGGSLRLRAKEIQPEIIPGALRLKIIYEFERGA
jgi:hypothetical protein